MNIKLFLPKLEQEQSFLTFGFKFQFETSPLVAPVTIMNNNRTTLKTVNTLFIKPDSLMPMSMRLITMQQIRKANKSGYCPKPGIVIGACRRRYFFIALLNK